jgi:hypothetical protein
MTELAIISTLIGIIAGAIAISEKAFGIYGTHSTNRRSRIFASYNAALESIVGPWIRNRSIRALKGCAKGSNLKGSNE